MHLTDITMFCGPASGGVHRYILAKRAYCAASVGLQHSLVVPGAQFSRRDEGVLTTVTVPALPLLAGKGYRFPLRVQPWIDALTELKPDVIEAGDPYRLAWAAVRAGRRLDIPVVGFFHSDLMRMTALRFGGWTSAPIQRYIQHLYAQYDWVFAPSRIMTEHLQDLGLNRVSTQPLGVDTELFNPERCDPLIRATLGIPADARLLVYAGRNAIEKNLSVLFDAMRRLGAPYHLLLIGPDMPRPADIALTVVDSVADPRVLAGLLASGDALVHAGDQETFGLVIAEGMASGLPVIGVNGGAVPELVDDSVGALAIPNNPASFAAAVDSVFTRNPAALGAAARARMVAQFAWSARFEHLFTDLRQLQRRGVIESTSMEVHP
ncbi:MAG: glycosyltransferase [Halothiobacillus sp.]